MTPAVTAERAQTINTYRLDWSEARGAKLAKIIRKVDASVVLVQECTPPMRDYLCRETGLVEAHGAGNLAALIKPKVWAVEHDNDVVLTTGADNRRALAVVLKHRATGREVKFVNTHLTNLEGGGLAGEGWRLGQIAEVLRSFSGIDVLAGDFNSRKAVYAALAAANLLDLRLRVEVENEDAGHGWIDNLLTRQSLPVLAAGVVDTGDATDHPTMWAEIGVDQ